MGLDQYIHIAKEYLEEDYYKVLGEAVKDENGEIAYYDEESVLTEIAYFRKSNWLHGYLDRLCESKNNHDIGNCEYFVFNQQDLINLLDACREVVECDSIAIAEETLPPQEGFFFGSTAIDDYYFEDVQDFINTMKEYEEDDNQYVYYAWW